MSAPILVMMRQVIARAIEDKFAEEWAAHRLEAIAHAAEEAIRECQAYPEHDRVTWRRTFDAICDAVEQDEPIDWQGIGEELLGVFDASLGILLALQRWVSRVQDAGQPVANAARLTEAIASTERFRADVFDHWPSAPTPEEIAEAIADYERGDSLPLDEAFAEIASMPKEAWRRKVEERKQQLRAEGKDRP